MGSISPAVFPSNVHGETVPWRECAGEIARRRKTTRLDSAQETEAFTPLDRT